MILGANQITELSLDGIKSQDTIDPIEIELTKQQQSKRLNVICSGRSLNPGSDASLKLTYELEQSTGDTKDIVGSPIESLGVVPKDTNYAILAEERNVTVKAAMSFGLQDVGVWIVNCEVDQSDTCQQVDNKRQMKIRVSIPTPIITCPDSVNPVVIPEGERVSDGSNSKTGANGKKKVPMRASIVCNVTDGKVVTEPEDQLRLVWTWDDRAASSSDEYGYTDDSAPLADPSIQTETELMQYPLRGYKATLSIDDVQDSHLRTYTLQVNSAPGRDGTGSQLLAEEDVELTAGWFTQEKKTHLKALLMLRGGYLNYKLRKN